MRPKDNDSSPRHSFPKAEEKIAPSKFPLSGRVETVFGTSIRVSFAMDGLRMPEAVSVSRGPCSKLAPLIKRLKLNSIKDLRKCIVPI